MSTRVEERKLSVENEVELRALCNMLRLANAFTFGFARVNHPSLRERLVEQIRRELPGKSILDVTLDAAQEAGVVTQLEKALGNLRPDGLFV